MQANDKKHVATYFKKEFIKEDDQEYFIYNGTYFEQDRASKDWNRLPDLFSDKIKPEYQEYQINNN